MKAGSSRKDCLAAFLLRWVEPVVGELVRGCLGCDGCAEVDEGCMMSGAPGSPPPAARTGMTGLASCAPTKTVSDVNLMAVLFMSPSFRYRQHASCPYQP